MGATLEQFELTQRGLRRPGGQVPRGARAQPPRRDRGRRTPRCSRPAPRSSRPTPSRARGSSSTSGAWRPHARDQHERPQIARRAAGEHRFVGGLDRADRLPAGLRRPLARPDPLRRAVEVFAEQARGPDRRRRRPADHRDRAGHPRGQGGDLRRARGVRARPAGRCRSTPRSRCCRTAARCCSAPTSRAVLTTLEALRGRRDRPELLDRPGGHARRDPLPRRVLPGAGRLHPQRRPAAAGPGRRDDLPRAARAAGGRAEGVRRALRRRHRRRLLRHDARAHRRDRRARRRGRPASARAPAPRARRTCPR